MYSLSVTQAVLWVIVCGCLCLKPCRRMTLMTLLIILIPRPFFGWFEGISDPAKIGLILWWTLWCLIPFNLWILIPKGILTYIRSVQAEKNIAYEIVVRIPYLFLSLWLIFGLITYALIERDPIVTQSVPGPALIRVTEPICLSCRAERLRLNSHPNMRRIPIYRADSKSNFSIKKRIENQYNKNNFSILVSPDGQEVIRPKLP